MLHPVFESCYARLLSVWHHHRDLVEQRAPIPLLAQSRRELDRLRMEMWRIRRNLAPASTEMDEIAFVSFCPALETSVFIRHRQVGPDQRAECLCGRRISVEPTTPRHHGE